MNTPRLAAVTLMLALAGCSGGTGNSGSPTAPINPPFVPNGGTVPVSFTVANTTSPATGGSSATRAPRYVSPGTRSVAVYDGTTLIYVANTPSAQFQTVYLSSGVTTVTSGSCTTATPPTCTITVQTSIGPHTFDVVTYNAAQTSASVSTPPAFTGAILAEGEVTLTVVSGANPPQTVVPLGVAANTFFVGPTLTQRLNGTGALVGIIGTSYTFQYAIDDAGPVTAGYQIVQPGAYDNGPVTISETDGNSIVTMAPISQSTPPPAPGLQSFSVTCQNNGTATITAKAGTKPNATYASGLTYTASNYTSGTLGSATLQCVPNSATLPVTVQ